MATTDGSKGWRALPHGPLAQLEANLWRVEGTLPNMPLKRVMTIARLANRDLVIHNPVALDEDSMRKVEALGRPTSLVVPNGWHRLDAKPFARRYPDAHVFAPTGGRARVGQMVDVFGTYADFPADPSVSLNELDGTRGAEGVMAVRSGDQTTLVFADAIFNMPHLPGLQGFILRYLTQSSGGPQTSRIARLFLLKDKPAFAAHLRRLATPDIKRIIVAHHETITERPAEVLRGIAASL